MAIVVDRSVDLVTPFMTQMTYHGMLDESYNLSFSYIEMHKSILDSSVAPNEPGKPVYIDLRKDKTFNEIKDMNIRLLGKYKIGRASCRERVLMPV